MSEADPEALVRGHYRDLDAGDYEGLAARLAEEFRHVRGDMTLEGRDRFVRFMREERPETDTTHAVDAVLTGEGRGRRPRPARAGRRLGLVRLRRRLHARGGPARRAGDLHELAGRLIAQSRGPSPSAPSPTGSWPSMRSWPPR
ncbi:MAG: nuclear transport factor 2 family protein [Halobacteriales archaeon]|nr:nuclear transport factor 2 family protein [Halobacteriales archaeon]